MSSNPLFLAIRLEGPLQSWGFDGQFNHRHTGLMPTKSAIAGMCCAAMGYSRGSSKEREFLSSFMQVKMTAIAIPKNGMKDLSAMRIIDYHTVGGGYNPISVSERGHIAVNAQDGKSRVKHGQSVAVITHRQYLVDALFGVVLKGPEVTMRSIAEGLRDPVWGLWLGRKCCIPSTPIFAGIEANSRDALQHLIGNNSLDSYTHQVDVDSFSDGNDSINDAPPMSFQRKPGDFAYRRVHTFIKKQTK